MVKTILIGNVGNDAVIREVGERVAIGFSVAHSEKYKNKEGVQVEKTTWYNCTMWRNNEQSTNVATYLKKGTKVYIEGAPEAKIYHAKDGSAQIDNTIMVYELQLLSAKPKSEGGQDAETIANEPAGERYVSESDLPF